MPHPRTRSWIAGAFVVEHRPPSGAAVGGVLILPPLGYEDTSAYRPLRILADALAEAGFHTLRLDWPGLGDSAGSALDEDLPLRRLEAVRAALRALREAGHASVGVVGVRAGGLLAMEAGGFDELVLWGTPASGRALLREERAFHRMASQAFGAPPADAPALPAGAMEAGGFVMGAATGAALEAMVPRADPELRRALVLPREGASAAPELLAALSAHGAAVAEAAHGGLGDLLEDPYRSGLAPAVREAVVGFFSKGTARPVEDRRGASTLTLPGGILERPFVVPGGAGELSGVVCEPAGGARPGAAWTIFYNAGGVRRSGPNRLWTEAARALAAEGVPSLRVDVRDVGDSDGVSAPRTDLEAMYSVDSVADAILAIDAVRQLGAGVVDVVGLCSGAYLAVQAANARPVRGALLINCLAFVWDEDARSNGLASQIGRSLFNARRWRRLLEGRIDARQLARAIVVQARLRGQDLLARAKGAPAASAVDQLLHSVLLRGTHFQLVSSEADPSVDYLERHVPVERRPPLLIVPGVDHTLRPAWSHRRVVQWVLEQSRSR